jgi:integrase
LKNRLSQIGTGTFVGRKSERIAVRELADDFLREYRVNRRKSIDDVQARWNIHLKPFFAHRRAASVSSDLIVQYVDSRQQQRAANATINRELAALKRMFRLGAQATPPKVNRVPHFEMLEERNVRTGFIDDKQFSALSAQCAKVGLWFRALLEVAYTYGWRLRELLNLRVDQVDLALRVIRLEPGTTKNEEGREVTMTDSVFVLLKECVHDKGPDNYVFTRKNGKRVLDFRGAWESVCEKAGVPNLLFHDL